MVRIARELGYAGRPRESAEYWELTAGIFGDAESLERAGDAWSDAGEVARARRAYQRALSVQPDRPGVAEKAAKLDVAAH